jgi:hypothetical protein
MIKSFPHNPMAIFKLMDDIMDALCYDNSLIAISIKNAYGERIPYRQIIATIKSQIGDNPKMGETLFGESLLKRIQEFR